MTITFPPPLPNLLADLDGFRVEVDTAHKRADIILDRPPLNVITMPQRDQLRAAFEALDFGPRVRVIVLHAAGQYFSPGGEGLRAFSPSAQGAVKKLINDTEDTSLSIAIELEERCYSRLR